MPLWLALCDLWVAEHRGYTGLTVPFLIGAEKHLSYAKHAEKATQIDLAKLLFDLQRRCPAKRSVRVEMCGSRSKPVVKVADATAVNDVAELIRARKGESRLYLSQTYPHERTLDSAVEALWLVVGEAIASERYSYVAGTYRELSGDEKAFIERAGKQAT